MAYDVYPYTNLHNLNLDWVLQELKRIAAESASTAEAQVALKKFVDNWTEEQDVPAQVREEVEREINRLITSGELAELIGGQLPQLLANRKGRRFLFIGDSYANREGDWDDTLRTIWGLDIFDIVHPGEGQTMTGEEDSYIIRDGGYGFVGVSNGGRWLDLCLQHWPASLDKSTFTDIVIVGGYNDRGPITGGATSVDNVYAQMQQFASGFTDSFPNAQVWLFECGIRTDNVVDMARISTAYRAYRRASEVAPNWCYAGGEYAMHFIKSINAVDYHHPLPAGGLDLGIYIANTLDHVTPIAAAKGPFVMGAVSGVTLAANRTAYYTGISDGHLAYIKFQHQPRATFATPIEIGSNPVTIATLPNSAILASARTDAGTPIPFCGRTCNAYVQADGSTAREYKQIAADFYLAIDGTSKDILLQVAFTGASTNGSVVFFDLPTDMFDNCFAWSSILP